MKKIAIVYIGVVVAAGTLWMGVPSEQQAVAVSGCCKQRQDSGPWREIGTDLKRCKIENGEEKDDLFRPRGDTWWDMAC